MPTDSCTLGLLADLYELTMAAGYIETRFDARATFELFVRSLPPRRNFLVAAGLQQALEFLETVRFGDEEIAYLRGHPAFAGIGPQFFRFPGGIPFFRRCLGACLKAPSAFPASRCCAITAPIAEAQIVETALLAK